jgi:hypothetical protein
MPRYYFVVTNRNGRVVDSTGLLLPSDTLARSEAVAALRLIQAEDPGADWDSWAVEIFDVSNRMIARIELGRSALISNPLPRRKRGVREHGRAVARTLPSPSIAVRPLAASPIPRWFARANRSARVASLAAAVATLLSGIIFLTDDRMERFWHAPGQTPSQVALPLSGGPEHQQVVSLSEVELQPPTSEQTPEDGEPARATLSDGPQSGRYTGHLGHGVPRLERFAAIGLPRTSNALTIRVTRAAPSRTRLGLLHAGYKRSRRVREPIQFVLASRG